MISRQWDGSPTCVIWVQENIAGNVLLYDSWNGILQLKTPQGEKYVPAGWWIVKNDDGTVTVSPEESDA